MKSFTPDGDPRLSRSATTTAGNMVLAASGAVDHDQLVALAQERSPACRPSRQSVPRARERALPRRRSADRGRRGAGASRARLPGLPFRDGAHYPLQIFSSVLGGGLSSRLFQRGARAARPRLFDRRLPLAFLRLRRLIGISAGTAPEDTSASWSRSRSIACASAAADVTEAEAASCSRPDEGRGLRPRSKAPAASWSKWRGRCWSSAVPSRARNWRKGSMP